MQGNHSFAYLFFCKKCSLLVEFLCQNIFNVWRYGVIFLKKIIQYLCFLSWKNSCFVNWEKARIFLWLRFTKGFGLKGIHFWKQGFYPKQINCLLPFRYGFYVCCWRKGNTDVERHYIQGTFIYTLWSFETVMFQIIDT